MPRPDIYNLEEFAEFNQIRDIYGSAVVCLSADHEKLRNFKNPASLSSFYAITLMVDGWQEYMVNSHLIRLDMHDLFISLPYSNYTFKDCSDEESSIHLLVEKNFFEDLINQNEQLTDYSIHPWRYSVRSLCFILARPKPQNSTMYSATFRKP